MPTTLLNDHPPADNIAQRIDQLATQCVKCGLCLPHCPTYTVARNENESPRGRIALMQGAVREQVPISDKLTFHIDTCLSCRACEAVCPAGVKYEELFTTTRAWLNPKDPPSYWEKFLIAFLERPRLRGLLASLVRVYQQLPLLQKIINKLVKIKLLAIAQYIPTKAQNNVAQLAPHSSSANRTALLLSPCASKLFDQQTLTDAQKVIEYCDWKIKWSEPSYCCGALSLHAGQLPQAKQCATDQ